ncbi:hypothetical protein BKA65DRAFT_577094 [Rhexocercosporidium sp. MPI-PUGE-AT-0058]|nr:hypothetical protein BKA65DRAFT_577094 [Rhexocercosporidium sp. MPI-PUGE-AT-0058]
MLSRFEFTFQLSRLVVLFLPAPFQSDNISISRSQQQQQQQQQKVTMSATKDGDMVFISVAPIQTPSSTQEIDFSTTTTTPRMETPEADSLMSRFLNDAISKLTCSSPLPPNTPTKPKAMQSARTSSVTPPSTKTRLSFSLASQEHEVEFSQQFKVDTPNSKRNASWSGEGRESLSLDEQWKKGALDHWSPTTKSRQVVGSAKGSSKVYKSVDFGRLTSSKQDGWGAKNRKRDTSREVRKEVPNKRYMGTREDTMKENLPVLKPKAVEISPRKRTYPGLFSVSSTLHGLDTKEEKDKLCYNCGKKGHWFVDCLVCCGHCKGDGHRTRDCNVVGASLGMGY